MPYIMQALSKKPEEVENGADPFDRMLYNCTPRDLNRVNDNTYVVSMSSRTIVYQRYVSCRTASHTFLQICRARIMNLRSPWFIPDSVPIQIRAGKEHIRTALWYTMVRSIPSVGNADKMLAREGKYGISLSEGSAS